MRSHEEEDERGGLWRRSAAGGGQKEGGLAALARGAGLRRDGRRGRDRSRGRADVKVGLDWLGFGSSHGRRRRCAGDGGEGGAMGGRWRIGDNDSGLSFFFSENSRFYFY